MGLFRSKPKVPKWKIKRVHAIILKANPTKSADGVEHPYEFIDYDPNNDPLVALPEELRPYHHDFRVIMPLKGWIPGHKNKSLWYKLMFAMSGKKKRGLLIYDETLKMPVSSSTGYNTNEYNRISPEFFKKICLSKLASNFSKSLNQMKLNKTWLIVGIAGLVGVVILLRIMGVF